MINNDFYQKLSNDLNKININDTIGIQANTGIGKTFSLLKYFSINSNKFKKTLFILPTQFACDQWKNQFDLSKLCVLNSSNALNIILKNKNFNYDTVIIDEAHIDSKEYYSLFIILNYLKNEKHQNITLLLVSATFPKYSYDFFPYLKLLEYNDFNKYHTNIEYLNHDISTSYVNKYLIYDLMIEKILINYLKYSKILCFLATHNDCNEIKERLLNKNFFKKEILIFHGGLDEEEKQKVKNKFLNLDDYIIITTNIAESSITIPNLDLIIDSGIECRLDHNSYINAYASRKSLIQRAGRVGRTKNGNVIRLLSFKNFELDIPEYHQQVHNLDFVIIKCLINDINPITMFGLHIESDLKYIEELKIDKLNKQELQFIDKCIFQTYSSLLCLKLIQNKNLQDSEKLFILFCITLIDFYDKKPPKWLFFDKKISSLKKKKILINLTKNYNIENDLLMTQAHLLLTVFYQKNWRELATELNFNHKTLKDFFKNFFIIVKQIFGDNYDIKKVLNLNYNKICCNISFCYHKSCNNNKLIINNNLIDKARIFFWNQNYYINNNYNANYFFMNKTNYSYLFINAIGFNKFPQNYLNFFFTKNDKVIPSIWTIPPLYINKFKRQLSYEINKINILNKIRDQALIDKNNLIFEISNEVAYRPFKVKMLEEFAEFNEFVLKYNLKL